VAFTYFFRDIAILTQAADLLAQTPPPAGGIRIWDAGCAYGQEPFSLAILLAERLPRAEFERLSILATDIDISNQFDAYIQQGVYAWDDIKRMPEELRGRWFEQVQDSYRLDEYIRRRVRYVRHDLTTLKPLEGNLSLILSKNTLMHFSPEQRTDVLAMFAGSLRPGGYVALGQPQDCESAALGLLEPVPGCPLFFRLPQRLA